ncbi:hypothetical protein AVEN_218120-1 [Araneus ventricosus]|uniref:Uncharacterized protein n=1 Tax=Araneus ventricosus TaxID=182803 RepID=A0A4Y2I441_ARAVE|nr:hypothetical protein AVEN_218120-1 [Araneus ventricosus]
MNILAHAASNCGRGNLDPGRKTHARLKHFVIFVAAASAGLIGKRNKAHLHHHDFSIFYCSGNNAAIL